MCRRNTAHGRAQRAALTEHWGTTKALQENARRGRMGPNEKSEAELIAEYLAKGGTVEILPPADGSGAGARRPIPPPEPVIAKPPRPPRAVDVGPKEWWQCSEPGCRGTRQPQDLRNRCASCITQQANERLRLIRGAA